MAKSEKEKTKKLSWVIKMAEEAVQIAEKNLRQTQVVLQELKDVAN